MDTATYSNKLFILVDEYIKLSGNLCEILIAMKKALLSFDNSRLNFILDEKMVLNEQILLVNKNLEEHVKGRYGEFTKAASTQLQGEFPQIASRWKSLQSMMRVLKSHASDVRRIIRAIDQYHNQLKISLESARPKLYSQYDKKGYEDGSR